MSGGRGGGGPSGEGLVTSPSCLVCGLVNLRVLGGVILG